MTIEFRDTRDNYIKQWPNWSGVVPCINDVVLIHWGDNNEMEDEYTVKGKIISGTNSDKVILIVE